MKQQSLSKEIRGIAKEATVVDSCMVTHVGDNVYCFGLEHCFDPEHFAKAAKKKETQLSQKMNGTDPESMSLYRDEVKRNQKHLQWVFEHIAELGRVKADAESIKAIRGYMKEEDKRRMELSDRYYVRRNITEREYCDAERAIKKAMDDWRSKLASIRRRWDKIDVSLAWRLTPPNYIAMAERMGVSFV